MKRIFTRATDAGALFSKSKETAGKRPLTLIIEGAQNYVRGVQARVLHEPQSSVSPCQGHQARRQVHNNKMDTPILKGAQIFHNYIKPHGGLQGRTPAEAAGIKVGGEDK
jgi:hypothetical protein